MTAETVSVSFTTRDGKHVTTPPVDMATMRAALAEVRGGKARRMKPDAAFDAAAEPAMTAAAGELRAFVERLERLAEEKAEVAEQVKEVMSEAKGRGYDTRALRRILALRRRDAAEVAEEEAILCLYKTALGMS